MIFFKLPGAIKTHLILVVKIIKVITRASLYVMIGPSASSSLKVMFSAVSFCRVHFLWDKYLLKLFCCCEGYPIHIFTPEDNVDYSVWHWDRKRIFLIFVIYVQLLYFLAEVFSKGSLIEKSVYFILKDSTVSDLVTVIVVELALELLTSLAWIPFYLFWPTHFTSSILKHYHQFWHVNIEVVIDELWPKMIITNF